MMLAFRMFHDACMQKHAWVLKLPKIKYPIKEQMGQSWRNISDQRWRAHEILASTTSAMDVPAHPANQHPANRHTPISQAVSQSPCPSVCTAVCRDTHTTLMRGGRVHTIPECCGSARRCVSLTSPASRTGAKEDEDGGNDEQQPVDDAQTERPAKTNPFLHSGTHTG